MDWISKHWRVKDFIIRETPEKITFGYYHGDMGFIEKIIFYKKNNYVEIYDLDNYYGDACLYHTMYL